MEASADMAGVGMTSVQAAGTAVGNGVDGPTFGDLVRQACEARGMSVDWLARQIGMPPGSFRNYTTGRRKVPVETILAVADNLGVRPEPLFRAAGYDPSVGRRALAILPGATVPVPVVGTVPADPTRKYMASGDTVPYQPYSPNVRPEHLIALRVVGDCLAPDVQPGDTVIVDKSLEPTDGRLGVVMVDGEYSLKRVRRNADGWLLESNVGPMVPLESVEWCGRVVFSGRPHI
jgi:SOS-response transcriptional repressor LexA